MSGESFFPEKRSKPIVIGIVGSRRRNNAVDFLTLEKALFSIFQEGDRLVSGGCGKGADKFAEIIAQEKGITITIYYPDWVKHNKAAGFIRNTKIAEDCDVLLALPAADRTGGTEDTIKKATQLGKKVILL